MKTRKTLKENKRRIKLYYMMAMRWTRRAEFFRWLYEHKIFMKKAKVMNSQCVDMAYAYFIAQDRLLSESIEVLQEACENLKEGA